MLSLSGRLGSTDAASLHLALAELPICNKRARHPSSRQTLLRVRQTLFLQINLIQACDAHSTVTLFARFLGLSTSVPRAHAV